MGYLPPTTVADALRRIQKGDLILPAIQREYVWKPSGMENYQAVRKDLEKKDLYIDIVSSLRMVDLIDIADKDAQFKTLAAEKYGGSWRKLRTLGTSRNDVMHPARRLNTTVSALIEMRRRIQALTETAESILEL